MKKGEREIGNEPQNSTGKIFLNRPQMAHPVRSTIDKLDLIKLKSFCKAKEAVNRTKKQPKDWE